MVLSQRGGEGCIWKIIIMKRRNYFSMVELTAAIGIVAILAGIVFAGLRFAQSRAFEAQTIAFMEQFEIALENFHSDYGYYPIQQTAGDVDFDAAAWDLFTNKNGNNKIKKPYMEGIYNGYGKFNDGFGEPFQYQYPNGVSSRNTTKYALWSKGADGKNGNGDDICSWKQK